MAALDRELRALGHTVSVITTDHGAGATTVRGRSPLRDWRLYDALRKASPDIVHVHGRAHMVPPAVFYRASHPRSRVVFTFHTQPILGSYLPGVTAKRSYSKAGGLIVRELLRRCDAITAVARSIITNLNSSYSFGIKDFDTIPSGGTSRVVDARELAEFRAMNRLEGSFPVLSSVGVFSWDWKVAGHLVCIDALRLLLPAYPRALLLLAGDGQYRSYLKDYVQARGLDGRVRFLGNVRNPGAVLGATDIYLHMALNEGCSLALIEAMFAEKTIIASRRGGNEEVVRDDVSARLIEPDPARLATALLELLADRDKGAALARGARQCAVDAFAWDIVAKQYEALYLSILGQPNEPGLSVA